MEKISTARMGLKWGLICAMIGVVFSSIMYSTDIWKIVFIGFLSSSILYICTIFMAMREFKANNESYMTYSQGLSIGTLLSATAGIIGIAFDLIFKKFIKPTLEAEQLELVKEQLQQYGNASDFEQTQTTVGSSGLAFVGGVLIIIFFGFLASLIISALMKKDKSIFD